MGPLLAGLGGYGWRVVPVFAAIFLLWLVALRPQEWPQSRADWMQPDSWLAMAARAVVQLLLVVLCFGIGRGLAGVAGLDLHLPFMGPILLSFLAVPIARIAWPPQRAQELDSFLDEAIASVEASTPPAETAERLAELRLFAARLTEPLADLRDDTRPDVIEAHLHALQTHLPPATLLDALHDRLASPRNGRVMRRAFILQATDPLLAEACRGRAAPVTALQVAGVDADLLDLFARRCTALLDADADAWGDCPNEAALTEAALPPEAEPARPALAALAARNRALAPLSA
ncbi:hypothetical protein [Gemmobacter sp.]|uniref:hypothetical protein n=1 Tax=Gemmobacter sp. TaxID=1898957 RepID=UPI0025C2BC9B|nr:hypothetical protein [Gemmobacter sp.]